MRSAPRRAKAVKSVAEQADEMGTTILLVFLGLSKIALTLRLPIDWGIAFRVFGFSAYLGMFQISYVMLPASCAYEHGPMYVSSLIYILPGVILARIKYLDYLSDRRFRDSFTQDTRCCKRQNFCSLFTLIVITVFAVAGMMVYYNECGVSRTDEPEDATCETEGNYCAGEHGKMAVGMLFIALFVLCFVSCSWCVHMWIERSAYRKFLMQM